MPYGLPPHIVKIYDCSLLLRHIFQEVEWVKDGLDLKIKNIDGASVKRVVILNLRFYKTPWSSVNRY